jgi:hypothetical protein
MSKRRHTEAQMIGALKQLEAGRKAEDVAREVGLQIEPVGVPFAAQDREVCPAVIAIG